MLVRAHTHVKDLTANPGNAKKKKLLPSLPYRTSWSFVCNLITSKISPVRKVLLMSSVKRF